MSSSQTASPLGELTAIAVGNAVARCRLYLMCFHPAIDLIWVAEMCLEGVLRGQVIEWDWSAGAWWFDWLLG